MLLYVQCKCIVYKLLNIDQKPAPLHPCTCLNRAGGSGLVAPVLAGPLIVNTYIIYIYIFNFVFQVQ